MADPTETGVNLGAIFKLLEQADQSAQVDNPFASLTQGIQGLQWDPNQRDPFTGGQQYSMKDNIVGGLIKGLAGGVSKGFQENYQANQDDKANELLKSAMSGEVIGRPSGMNPSIFNNIRSAASIFDMERKAQKASHTQALQDAYAKQGNDTLAEIIKKKVADGDLSLEEAQRAFKPTGVDITGLAERPAEEKDAAIAAAFPNLSPEQVKAAKGDITKAATINTGNIKEEKPVPQAATAELQALDNAKQRVAGVMPSIVKLENLLKKNPSLTMAEIVGGKSLPFTDVAAIQTELPSLMMDLQAIKPSGGGKLPISEFHAITDAVNGTVPLAQGLTADRIMNIFNDRASAVKGSFDKSYNYGQTKAHAQHILESYKDSFAPIHRSDFAPTKVVGGITYVQTDGGWVPK